MMKNTEWGSVACLSHSVYGNQASVRMNNNESFITGYSAVSEPTCGYTGTFEFFYKYLIIYLEGNVKLILYINNEGEKMQKRVIVKQQDKSDCGICCLFSIIRYYDGYIPFQTIREDTLTTNRGTSAFHMVEALKRYGFDAYGTRLKKEKFFKTEFPLPAIVHVVLDNGLNHYMVLYEKRVDKVILMDPSIGKRVMSETDFFWIWSEVLLICYPKEEIRIEGKEKSFLTVIIQFLGREKKTLSYLIWLELILFVLEIASAFYLKFALNYLDRRFEITLITLLFTILLLFKILLTKEILKKTKQINKRIDITVTINYLEHVLSLPLSKFKNRDYSDYINRFWEKLELKFLYTDFLKNTIISFIVLSISLAFMYVFNMQFLLFFLLIIIIYILIQFLFQQQFYNIEHNVILEKTRFQEKLLDQFSNQEIYYYLNLKKKSLAKIEYNLITLLEEVDSKESFYKKYLWYQKILKESFTFLFLTLGVYLIAKNEIDLVSFMFIQTIGSYLTGALETLVNCLPKEKYLKNILKKECEFLNLPTECLAEEKSDFVFGDISLKDISFTYNNFQYVLKNLNLLITEKNHVLILGKSGCGKSTFCKLLLRVYKPSDGSIKIGGINIEDLNLNSLRSSITYLNQKSNLITGTIRENIIMNRNFDSKRFDEVCRICKIEDIVSKRPLRYESIISNHESNFSGGEKQRIMLARTIYTKSFIYLLDESLSEVDDKLEKEIIKEMRIFLKEKTLIYISHKNHKNLFDEIIKMEGTNERILIS